MRPVVVLACLAVGALGCSVTTLDPPGPTGSTQASSTPMAVSAVPDETPLPDLPALAIDPARILQWCDPWPGLDPEVQPIDCTEAIEAAVRATGPLQGSIFQADSHYSPPCVIPDRCGPALPNRAFVILLSRAAGPLLVEVVRTPDQAIMAFAPKPGPAPSPAPAMDPPAVQRPNFPGASDEFREREPFPFCGRGEMFEERPAINRCFVLSVRSGTPAEMILDGSSVEGDPVTVIYRFAGSGAVIVWFDSSRDPLSSQQWYHRPCAMYRFAELDRFGCG